MRQEVSTAAGVLPHVVLVALTACSGEGVTFEGPLGSEEGVQRPTLVVEVGVDSADAALADSLGWSEGVPGAEVNILRNGTLDWIVDTTDATGRALFTELEPGRYRVWAQRLLTPEEAEGLGGPMRAFGDGRTVTGIGRDTTRARLELYADRPGSLVIAEVSDADGEIGPLGALAEISAWYFEVYNQGEETRYLDGVLFGALLGTGCEGCFETCAETESLRLNPDRLGTPFLLQFPGGGTDHPIAPGELRMVAVAAQDHSQLDSRMPDLTAADFELVPSGVADNPGVPNMQDIGPRYFDPQLLSNVLGPKFLAERQDVEALPVVYRDANGRPYLGVSRPTLLDVVLTEYVSPQSNLEHPECIPRIGRDYDRYPGFMMRGEDPRRIKSFQRRALRMSSGGWPILMNTNTSAVDLREIERTPGRLP